MEYCLSTVNEFLTDIRAFQKRVNIRKSTSGLWTDSSDPENETKTGDMHSAPSLNVNELVRGFVKQLLQAILALHEHCIIHCDVKGDNIFIANENGHYIVKLGVSHEIRCTSVNTCRSIDLFDCLGFQSFASIGIGITNIEQ
jgi:serine/threonine protein kinase